jgi:hypothetical protein
MPTDFLGWKRLKSRKSKRAGNPETQNGRHPPDGLTPVVLETPVCNAETSSTPELSQPQNLSIAASVNGEDSMEGAFISATELQAPSTPPVITDAEETPASSDAAAKKPRLPASAVQETSKASSSHPAQAQVPPSVLSVTDAQAGLAGAGPRAKEPQPTTELAAQQTQAISTSQRLWNEAYDSLENDNNNAGLVKAYVNTLTMFLKAEKAPDNSASGSIDVSAALKDPTKRQMHMRKLVEDSQTKILQSRIL